MGAISLASTPANLTRERPILVLSLIKRQQVE
jgi:hypothetical protein